MNGFMKLVSIWALLSIVLVSWAQEKSSDTPLSDAIVHNKSLGKAFDFPLGVRSAIEKLGRDRADLEGFDLSVEATFLGPNKLEVASARLQRPTTLYANEKWFRRHAGDSLQYIKYEAKQNRYEILKEDDWQQRIQIDARPLHKFGTNDQIGNFVIRSRIKMARYDFVELGRFDFQPNNPGLYRIDLKLYRINSASAEAKGKEKTPELVESRQLHVYFQCPDYRPILSFAGSDTIQLRDIGYEYIHTPIVNTIFFENADRPLLNENPTDRIFRALLLGRAAVGLSCPESIINLHAFPDPLYVKDHPGVTLASTLEYSERRAKYIEQELGRLSTDFISGIRCGARTASNTLIDGTTRIEPSQCGLSFKIQKEGMDSELAPALIKKEDSIDEGVKYRQENRVIALTVDSTIEKRLFEPLAIKQKEVPDYVQFRLKIEETDSLMPKCLDAGWIVVRSLTRGNSTIQVLSNDELEVLRIGEIILFLDSEALQSFLSIPGDYEARVAIRSLCDATTLYSEGFRFHVKATKSVMLDEIFALSPFDRVAFSYKYDEERIPQLTERLFQQIEERLKEETQEEFPLKASILISGHTDVLSQHRGSFYNLGLSFQRAYFAQQKFLAEIRKIAKRKGYTLTGTSLSSADTTIFYYVSNSMRSKMSSSLYAKTSTQEFFKTLPYKPYRTKEQSEYYETLKTEKLRHFTTEPRRPFDPLLPYSVGAIMARLREIDDNVACGLTTLAMRYGRREVTIDVFTAGFGAAIPFYRRFSVTDELKTIFCAGGLASNQIPNEIFADDEYPSGRVMNRRIEVNLIMDRAASATNSVSRE